MTNDDERGAEHGSLRQQPKDPAVFRHGIVRMTLAYGAALAAAAVTWLALSPHLSPLWATFAADMAGTLAIFAFSFAHRNSSFYDAYWSVAPVVIAGLWITLPSDAPLALVTWWGVRLTVNWVRSWTGLDHEDWRYVDLKRKSGKGYWLVSLCGLHGFPTVQVVLGMLAAWAPLTVGSRPLGWLDAVALVVTAGAIAIEQRADNELDAFLRTRQPGQILESGLWAHARHPNYFGEMSFWWGLWLFTLAADPSYAWTAIGPLAISLMIVFISIPMLDTRSRARRPDYEAYAARTRAFLPLPRLGARKKG